MRQIMSDFGGVEPRASELEFVVVTRALLVAFARGELDAAEAEAMQAFLDDHPELEPEAGCAAPPQTRRS